jgi:hypothetical protein
MRHLRRPEVTFDEFDAGKRGDRVRTFIDTELDCAGKNGVSGI